MRKNLEQNYISVVAVINDKRKIAKKIFNLDEVLKNNFKNYEIVLVDNTNGQVDLSDLGDLKYTLIKLPMKHGSQQALNAGVALAIGDYLVEIEDLSFELDYGKIVDLYQKSQSGYDFVFLTPKKSSWSSRAFYKILNRYFRNTFKSDIGSSVMTLSSRRGQNKVAELGRRVVNRNVVYAVSGLKSASIEVDLIYKNQRSLSDNLVLMFDTLIFYTDVIMLVSQRIALLFFVVFGVGTVYALTLWSLSRAIEGWASLFLLLSLGFSVVFFILSIVVRYLHHILRSSLKTKDYIFGSVDKK